MHSGADSKLLSKSMASRILCFFASDWLELVSSTEDLSWAICVIGDAWTSCDGDESKLNAGIIGMLLEVLGIVLISSCKGNLPL